MAERLLQAEEPDGSRREPMLLLFLSYVSERGNRVPDLGRHNDIEVARADAAQILQELSEGTAPSEIGSIEIIDFNGRVMETVTYTPVDEPTATKALRQGN
jgi:hypothetical protein